MVSLLPSAPWEKVGVWTFRVFVRSGFLKHLERNADNYRMWPSVLEPWTRWRACVHATH